MGTRPAPALKRTRRWSALALCGLLAACSADPIVELLPDAAPPDLATNADLAMRPDLAVNPDLTVTCAPPQQPCAGVCVDTDQDGRNCGSCGVICPLDLRCVGGKCALVCPGGLTICGGACADLASDGRNCGACGAACAMGNVCSMGMCQLSCQAGLIDCSGSCVNPKTDNANCGACGSVCPPGTACSGGACAVTCAAPLVVCGGACVDPRFDPANCGGCRMACALANSTPACLGGRCAIAACLVPFADCNGNPRDGCEVNLGVDPANCGGCGAGCSGNHVLAAMCAGGACTGNCAPGFGDCDKELRRNGCEIPLDSDLANCGACGRGCSGNHVAARCQAGVCNGACDAGFADCDGNKATNGCEADVTSDVANCGACGKVCPGACSNGACVVTLQPDGMAGKDTYYGSVFTVNGNPTGDYVAYGGWGDFYYGFIEFDLTTLPASANTLKAELMLSTKDYFAPNDPVLDIHRVTSPWTEVGITRASNPSHVFEKSFGKVVNGWNTVDITALYKGWKDGTFPNYGVELWPNANNQTNGGFASSDHMDATIRPKLVITMK